jgi:N-acetyl-gamma-glutamyl-phosphate reductase
MEGAIMVRVGIIGASGYAGAELVRILSGHPAVQLTLATSRQHAGSRFDSLYPALKDCTDIQLEPYSEERVCQNADIVFTALPHRLPMSIVPEILANDRKVIDLSADFRFSDPERYGAAYQSHTAPDLLKEAVYGLSEVYADRIRSARLVGNPGCYPTSVLLPLVPLVRGGLVEREGLIADSKSGVSGAGRSPVPETLYCEVNECFRPYKVGAHRHTPEMEAILGRETGKSVRLTFVPHLVPMNRGMQSTIYARPAQGVSAADIAAAFSDAYAGCAFIRICSSGQVPDVRYVRGTNFCDIGFKLDEARNRLILMSAIDNLVKGAAGQAVQNMNIMLGLDETTGLGAVPFPV